MTVGISFFQDHRTDREVEEDDCKLTGRFRCIGCGRFLPADLNWNQCADCDTRTPEDF